MIHSFRLFGDNVVLDIDSNGLYVFDDLAAELLSAWSERDGGFKQNEYRRIACKYGESETGDAAAEISELVATGALFSGSPLVDGNMINKRDSMNSDESRDADTASLGSCGSFRTDSFRTGSFKSLCLHLAHDCNMSCAYCFASEGSFGLKRELMSEGVARAAIDFVVRSSGSRKNIEIDFFGGEPLLNFDVLKRTVDYARSVERGANKNFRFTLTTNGLLLDKGKAEYINANMDNLVLSIDGRQSVNDRMRKTLDGSGTYDAIVENYKSVLKDRDKSWYMRGTYTSKNKDFASDVEHLADLGFLQLSIEPVVAPADAALDFDVSDLPDLFCEYERLALIMREREISGNPFHFFHFNIDLEEGPCAARRAKGCGAGFEYAAVAPDGDIYPCHQFVGVDGFKLGNVTSGTLDGTLVRAFSASNILGDGKCADCWAKYFCGGGCAANAWHYNRDIHKPNDFYCALLKKRVECALWLICSTSKNEFSNTP